MRDTKSEQLIALIRDQYRGAAVVAPGMPLVTDVIDALENEAAGARVEAATLRQQIDNLKAELASVHRCWDEDCAELFAIRRARREARAAAVAVVETPEGETPKNG